jgi:tetratricopeptide (TPR) repeat protein
LDYFKLGDDAWRKKMKYYEDNLKWINALDFDDKIEMEMDYLLCLFEVGRYERYLSKVDPILEVIISENIFTFKGENIFNELLFRKAACYYQADQWHEAKIILKQLINIDKSNAVYMGLYSICCRKLNVDYYAPIKATAMASFILVIIIAVADIFLEPLFEIYIRPIEKLKIWLFAYGCISLITIEIIFQWRIKRETGMFSFAILNKIFGKKI